jgi:hypothetical protein
MLEQVLLYLNNWFEVAEHRGEFSIEDGSITLPFLATGQYFRIVGSVFNNGLHQYPANDLTDETFTGAVFALAVPPVVVSLTEEMSAWQEKNGEKADGPFQSESFAGYTYTKASNGKGGTVTVWDAFKTRLAAWRKL